MDVFMREVECSHCGTTIRHRAAILEEIIQRQSELSQGERYINFACPECNMLTRSRVVRGAKIFREMDLSKFPDDLTISCVSLRCAKAGCESRVILLAAVKSEVPEAERLTHMLTNWHNRSAVCANGHSPAEPLDFQGSMQWAK